jgi:hypothetical protein
MTLTNYNNALDAISPRILNLQNYPLNEALENDWINYIKNIFLPNYNQNNQLRIICCESGPGNIANYMFTQAFLGNIITAQTDRYLQQIYTGVFPNINALPTRSNAFIQLANENILIELSV